MPSILLTCIVPQVTILQTLRKSRTLAEQKGRDEVPSDSQEKLCIEKKKVLKNLLNQNFDSETLRTIQILQFSCVQNLITIQFSDT